MQALALLTPWFAFVLVLWPTLQLERWLHQHLYGVGWLLTRDAQRATILYYLFLLPGVFLHEFTQWLVAGGLRLKTSALKVWPKPQANGTLRLDFVKLSGRKNSKPAVTVFETAPLVVGIAAILLISQRILGVDLLLNAFRTADLGIVRAAFDLVLNTPDFWLWLYLLFAVGNAMFPTTSLNLAWLLPGSLLIGVAFLVLGLLLPDPGAIILLGPLAAMLRLLATAASTMLVMNGIAVIVLSLVERLLEHLTGEQAKYPRPKAAGRTKLEPGGETPLPENQAPQRIAERRLPIPPPPPRNKKPKRKLARQVTAPPDSTRASGRPSWIQQHASSPEDEPGRSEDVNEQAVDTANNTQHTDRTPQASREVANTQAAGENPTAEEPTYIDLDSDIA